MLSSGGSLASCAASVDYESNTPFGLSFSQRGPVFNLPAGWTANSLDGSIVNNMLVPEPSTWVLIAIPLMGLAVTRRRGE